MTYCTQNVKDLNIENAREYTMNILLLAAFPLTIHSGTDNHQESRADALKRLYKVPQTPSRSNLWEWLTHCGFKFKR